MEATENPILEQPGGKGICYSYKMTCKMNVGDLDLC